MPRVRNAGRMAEALARQLAPVFGRPLSSRQTIVLYASHPCFRGDCWVPDGSVRPRAG